MKGYEAEKGNREEDPMWMKPYTLEDEEEEEERRRSGGGGGGERKHLG